MTIFERTKTHSSANYVITPESPFLLELFETFKASNIDYCVLRNYEGLPHDLRGSDLDILLTKASLRRSRQIMREVANRHHGFAIWREWNDCLLMILCSGICENGNRWGVHIDLFTAIQWKGLDYYPADYVISRAIEKNGVYIANPCDASLIAYLKDILQKCGTRESYASSAANSFKQSPNSTYRLLRRIFGRQVHWLVGALHEHDFVHNKSKVRKLRRAILIRQMLTSPVRVVRNKIKRRWVHCNRLWNRPGIFVALLGVDGAGKSSLIDLVRRDFERLIHTKPKLQHSRPNLLPPIARLFGRKNEYVGPLINPHARPPSKTIGSILRLAYYTVDYLIGYWFRVYPTLVKHPTAFFFDRYFYDYFVDPERYRVNLPPWVITLFEFLVPKPDGVILIKVDPRIAIRRKPELPLDEVIKHSVRLQNLERKLERVEWIDTSYPIEQCRDEIVNLLLKRLREQPGWK